MTFKDLKPGDIIVNPYNGRGSMLIEMIEFETQRQLWIRWLDVFGLLSDQIERMSSYYYCDDSKIEEHSVIRAGEFIQLSS